MSGVFVAIVGPSGAGKDSLIAYAKTRLGDQIAVVRRVVTRPADGGSEDHDCMSPEEFHTAAANQRFALSWQAHGLHYGLPAALEDDLAAGRVVVANLSRAVIPRLLSRYPQALVVEVNARPAVIAARLAGRGRENETEIRRRMERAPNFLLPPGAIRIDNSGALADAGEAFVAHLEQLLGFAAQP